MTVNRLLLLAALTVCLIPAGASGQDLEAVAPPPYASPPSCPAYTSDGTTPIGIVRYLSDDALQGRFAGSAGERCAGEFIADRFEELGLEPAGGTGWFQTLELTSAAQPHAPAGVGRNVLALLPGSDPDLAGSVVVVGAHYDHLGFGEFGSTGEAGEVHNGADDNASGVAAMLEAARILSEGPRPARSILFIAFTGEELGLIGSSHYVRNPAFPLARTLAMVNLDMVGRLGEEAMIVYGMGTAPEWEDLVPEANRDTAIPLAYEAAGYGPSDHTSFYAADIPVLHFFTNVHRDYHRETDDWPNIDVAGLERVARFTAEVAGRLADRPTRLTLVPGVGDPGERAGGYGAWLGTVPDFTPVDTGVLLAGVTAGGPADEADLRKGDVIVRIGTHDVEDLQGMTDALSAHVPGQEVTIWFLRDERRMTTTAILGDRADRP
ncbi:MAG: M20/M25/M40 family metallo-hydrolase [Gemmatimonadota bacterium]|nr:M20/M25/M40 family metallo-hydrolase [Gemmatimonadota bacterium]